MNTHKDNIAVVLAAHGAPATDYPAMRVGMLMMLEFGGKPVERLGFLRRWRSRLAGEVAGWPRTAENDPYKAAVDSLAEKLALRLGCPVVAAYNEFCIPTIPDALDQVIAGGAGTVIVTTTMLLRGNQHTEQEIQEAVIQARQRHPAATIHYAWPFEERLLVNLLSEVVSKYLPPPANVQHETGTAA